MLIYVHIVYTILSITRHIRGFVSQTKQIEIKTNSEFTYILEEISIY